MRPDVGGLKKVAGTARRQREEGVAFRLHITKRENSTKMCKGRGSLVERERSLSGKEQELNEDPCT